VIFAIEKALAKRVVLLAGDEELLRLRALRELVDRAGGDEFDRETMEGGDASPEHWLAAAMTVPFLADRRMIVVRNVLRSETVLSADHLKAIPDTGFLILVLDEEGSADARSSKIANRKAQWKKAVESGGGYVAEFSVDGKQIGETLRGAAQAAGKTISPKAIDLLLEMVGGSVGKGLEEIEKLVLFVGDEPQIREADVRASTVTAREWNVFAMVDAMLNGQVGEALRQLRILMGVQGKADDAAMRQIFPQVSRQLRLLWQARLCLDAGVKDPLAAPPEISRLFPESPNLAKQKPYPIRKSMELARTLSLESLAHCFQALADADARMKGQLPGYSTQESLERMIFEMAEVARNRPLVSRSS
jgi:DNA polymerase-3 subunit delta